MIALNKIEVCISESSGALAMVGTCQKAFLGLSLPGALVDLEHNDACWVIVKEAMTVLDNLEQQRI